MSYDRDVLVTVLVYHWRTSTSGCGCGWAKLGASHAEHVADVYEESSWYEHNAPTVNADSQESVTLELTPTEAALVRQAADLRRVPVAEFIRSAALLLTSATSDEPPVGTIIERPDGALWIHEPPDGEDMRPSGSGGTASRDRSWFRLDLGNDDPETWVKIQASAVVIRRGGRTFGGDAID